jgi:hypothetical protein
MDIGYNRALGFIAELVSAGELYEWRVKRAKTNPEIRISRYPQVDPE